MSAMKNVIVLFVMLGAAFSQSVPLLTAYDYHRQVGIPLAVELRKTELEAPSLRIVGGRMASLGQFPYQCGLVITLPLFLTSVCGSSLLSQTRSLTAAHCWFDGFFQARSFTVACGTLTLFFGGEQRIATTAVTPHPNWDHKLISNDVAVIRHDPFTITPYVQPIRLASSSHPYHDFQNLQGEMATASGYGKRRDSADGISLLTYLSYVHLRIISNEECERALGHQVTEHHVCTSGENARNVCSGDSGGPLTVTRGSEQVLVGVVSFGSRAGCQQGFPSAYARVSSHEEWIRRETGL